MAIAALALTGALGSASTGLLMMLPALALAALMLTRPYLGERVIARMRSGRIPRRARTARAFWTSHSRTPLTARGGRLIAAALAGRAPPVTLAGWR